MLCMYVCMYVRDSTVTSMFLHGLLETLRNGSDILSTQV